MAARSASTSRQVTPRLAADDWIRAALDVMADDGIAAVKIPRLCERLGVTKGSFYWHFDDLDSFLGEVARRWADDGARLHGELRPEDDAGATLLQAMHLFADRRNRNLARAVREWAQSDERARAAIRKADRALYEKVKHAIVGLGFDDDEADVRAKMLYYAGVGFAHVGTLGSARSPQDQLAATWEIITRR